jgi:hypothetical protein
MRADAFVLAGDARDGLARTTSQKKGRIRSTRWLIGATFAIVAARSSTRIRGIKIK